jgi:hypothetical protein
MFSKVRLTTDQRSSRDLAEDKDETLETYGTRYTGQDSQTSHLDATEKDMTENLTQDRDCESYYHFRTQASSFRDAEEQAGGSTLLKYPKGNQTGEYHRDVGDSLQLNEGKGGSVSEPLRAERVDSELTPNDFLEVESVNNAGEQGGSTPRYNLRPFP